MCGKKKHVSRWAVPILCQYYDAHRSTCLSLQSWTAAAADTFINTWVAGEMLVQVGSWQDGYRVVVPLVLQRRVVKCIF